MYKELKDLSFPISSYLPAISYNYHMLTWTEIETRAIAFQRKWRSTPATEKQDEIK
jgi:hypothetical protein